MRSADVLTILRNSHDRFRAAVSALTEDQVTGQSYDDGWTIAQVASHLGSGAEIYELILEAGLTRAPTPGPDEFAPVWEAWNGKSPARQVADAVRADAAFLDHVAAVPEEEADRWRLNLFGGEQTLATALLMRLSEHAVHTWDIVVALDPPATLPADATEALLDLLARFAEYAGKGDSEPGSVHITTTGPAREFVLTMSEGTTRLEPVTGSPAAGPEAELATLRLPAEALIRLVYGRLDPGHTPSTVEAHGISLDSLRRRFPGI
jgi:uncharacterized protein (TIGR03083 family)